jgi:hypothetical protein
LIAPLPCKIATPSISTGWQIFAIWRPECLGASLDEGGSMKTTILSFLFISVCTLFGCASQPVPTPSAAARPAANPAPEQPPVTEAKPEPIPARPSVPAVKREKTPAEPAKVTANNEINVKTETVAHKETKIAPTEIASKEKSKEKKPAEMKVANALDRNTYLSSEVKPLLPPRTTVMDAATGFKKEKEFLAAAHLSRNLGIPFDQIKTRMTAEHRMSLTDALRDIRSDMSKKEAKEEVKKAEGQAKEDEHHAKDDAKVLSASSRK